MAKHIIRWFLYITIILLCIILSNTQNAINMNNRSPINLYEETEKIIKVHDTDQNSLNQTNTNTDFMNENLLTRNSYKKNLNGNFSIINNNIIKINNSNGDSSDITNNHNNITIKSTPSFEEFTYEYDNNNNNNNNITITSTTTNYSLNSQNIYKVSKIKKNITTTDVTINNKLNDEIDELLIDIDTTKPTASNSELIINKTNLYNFKIISNLYDHLTWNKTEIFNIVDRNCGIDMNLYLNALHNEEAWALKVIDSSGKYRGQFFFGNNIWIGAGRFCYQIQNDNKMKNFKPIGMGFFVATVLIQITNRLIQKEPMFIGQCLPKSCSAIDIERILKVDPSAQAFLQDAFFPIELNRPRTNILQLISVRRVPGDYNVWTDEKFYVLIIILIIIGLSAIIGTIIAFFNDTKMTKSETTLLAKNSNSDVTNSKTAKIYNQHFDENRINMENTNCDTDINCDITNNNIKIDTSKHKCGLFRELLTSFDLLANSKSILSTKIVTEDSVSCVHGMRLFSMLWIIMVHSYLLLYHVSENRYQRNLTERNFWYQLIGNATYSVDTFFFISGLLVTLLFLRAEKSQIKKTTLQCIKKIILAILYRFIRLTPALIFVILFTEVSLKYSYNQSVFPPGIKDHLACSQYWWRTLLYIQNWYPLAELCMTWSWYLANDMQFYIWAIIVLLMSTRYFKTSATIVGVFLLLSCIITALISLNHNYSIRITGPFDSFGFLYDRPWTRMGPYIMGMITGYIIFKIKTPPKISTLTNIIFIIISITILFIVVFGLWNGSLSVKITSIYVSLSHTAWGFALIWITLSCKWNFAKYINKFLSYPGFLPFSRLTYCVYLIHPLCQALISNNLDGTLNIQHSMILTIFLGNAAIAYFCAFMISLLFEAPFVKILRIFFKK